jgi:hypothetical protein
VWVLRIDWVLCLTQTSRSRLLLSRKLRTDVSLCENNRERSDLMFLQKDTSRLDLHIYRPLGAGGPKARPVGEQGARGAFFRAASRASSTTVRLGKFNHELVLQNAPNLVARHR